MDPSGRIALARIEGDIRLVLSGQERQVADFKDFKRTVERTLEKHDSRLESLETTRTQQLGQKQGIVGTFKAMWFVVGAAVTAVFAAVMRKLGLI